MEDDFNEVPKAGAIDWAHAIVKAGLSAIPFAGGPVAELFAAVITPPIAKRRDEWLKSLIEGLKELGEKVEGFSVESLAGNELFVTSFLQASHIAIRNHQKEKLNALRNAVLNSASNRAPDEDRQLMFLHLIDSLTSWHLRALRFFKERGATALSISRKRTLQADVFPLQNAFPELKYEFVLPDQIIMDLLSRGLVEDRKSVNYGVPAIDKRVHHDMIAVTLFGEEFLDFIASPLE